MAERPALLRELLAYEIDGIFFDWIRTGDVRDNPQTDANGVADSGYEPPLVDKFKAQPDVLTKALEHSGGSAEKHAKYMRDKIVPAMSKLREIGDEIEVLTPHEIWPLPTYREMLFVK